MIKTEYLHFNTKGNTDIIDITPLVSQAVKKVNIKEGIVCISCIGSTGALTTIEYESALLKDFKNIIEEMISEKRNYFHNATWQDDNGHSHLRASFIGPSLIIPITLGNLELGTWQQIVFIDFDIRPRRRKLVLKFIGE